MLGLDFVAGLLAPLACALREVPEAGFAFEAILVVEAIAGLSVEVRTVVGTVTQKYDGGKVSPSTDLSFLF